MGLFGYSASGRFFPLDFYQVFLKHLFSCHWAELLVHQNYFGTCPFGYIQQLLDNCSGSGCCLNRRHIDGVVLAWEGPLVICCLSKMAILLATSSAMAFIFKLSYPCERSKVSFLTIIGLSFGDISVGLHKSTNRAAMEILDNEYGSSE